jgi:hypothetical protein
MATAEHVADVTAGVSTEMADGGAAQTSDLDQGIVEVEHARLGRRARLK